MTAHADINLLSPAFKANPYPVYAELRAQAPVYRSALPDGSTVWIVTRYEEALQVLKDSRFVKDYRSALTDEQLAEMPPIPPILERLSASMLERDPPDHTRLRTLVSKAFTPARVEQLRPRIQQLADGLLDAVQNRGQMDLIDAYAFPLPIMVIAELLGVPVADRDRFREWSNVLVQDTFGMTASDEEIAAMTALAAYLQALFEQRQAQPEDDLISALIQAEQDGDTLSPDELLSMVVLLLIAGHETTVNLIGNGVLALLRHPDQLALLKREPGLIASAIEEFLRFDGPIETASARFAREAVTLGGALIPRGEMVLVVLAAADHDPAQFGQPERLDITRERNRHLGFGHGIHYCLGAPLARIEGQIAIGTLLRRMPDLRLDIAPEELLWRPGMLIRGLQALPVAWSTARSAELG